MLHTLGVRRHREMRLRSPSPRETHLLAERRVSKELGDDVRPAGGLVAPYDAPRDPIFDDFLDAASCRRHQRKTGSHRLDEGPAKGLRGGRVDQQVGRLQDRANIPAEAGKDAVLIDTQLPDLLLESGPVASRGGHLVPDENQSNV